MGLRITREANKIIDLVVYTNFDWGGTLDRRSIIGSSIWYGNNLLSWSAKKQLTISNSSAKVEFKVMAHFTSELRWYCYLFGELDVKLNNPPLLLCDNRSTIFMAKNPTITSRFGHIEISYYFVK